MASSISPSSMLAVGAVLPALSIVAVCARIFVRITYKQGMGADDWLIIPAMLMVVGMGIAVIMGQQAGLIGYNFGALPEDLEDSSLVYVEKLELAITLMDILNLGLVKLSILYFYKRIFVTGTKRRFEKVTDVFTVILVLWTIAMFFMNLFFCGSDVSVLWSTSFLAQQESCGNAEAGNLFYFSTDVLFDFILMVMPIPLIMRLQLSGSRRVGIVFVFALGGLALVASILRLVIFGLQYSGNDYDFVGQDIFIAVALFFYWTMIESGIAVIAACLPTLQVWFRKTSVEAVARNVLGIFSIQSLSRSQRTQGQFMTTKDAHSSSSNLRSNSGVSVELAEVVEHRQK